MKQIPIIDIFAGPGGLGEGFTALTDENGDRIFRIALSIEKDTFAHRTLTLRSFVRQFPVGQIPDEYYEFVSGKIGLDELYNIYPEQYAHAVAEAWKIEVGDPDLHPIIDERIRQGLQGEQNFILIGGPPCQAYSLVGRSRRQELDLNENDPRVYLYREYYRILAEHKPSVFVMENVKGLLSAKVDSQSIFHQVINDLKNPVQSYLKLNGRAESDLEPVHYKIYSLVCPGAPGLYEDTFEPRDFIVKTEEYGVPQTRHRVILLGIRADLDLKPEQLLVKANKQATVHDVISTLPTLRSGLSKGVDNMDNWLKALKESIGNGTWDSVEESVRELIVSTIENIPTPKQDRGSLYLNVRSRATYLAQWFTDNKLKGIANHETRSHIQEDIYRYLFASCFAQVYGKSPKLIDFPTSLHPKHLNLDKALSENKFGDRFRVQLVDLPSKTVTSHISKDGHYYIHPDPSQCRSLTVREAARIQTFPDNYYFCGPRTEQFHQVGNAVPPYLAYQISKVVNDLLNPRL